MTDKEILQKAIEKAEKNGYKLFSFQFVNSKEYILLQNNMYYAIIFSHDFAKAFWGKSYKDVKCNHDNEDSAEDWWEYHIRKMALEPEPLKYIEKFL